MSDQATLEQVKEQVNQLSWHDQIQLITYISEQLSNIAIPEANVSEMDSQKQREKEADEILALCDAVAKKWSGPFDAVEDIRKLREERDESIWPSR
jgi:hypothetical protein